MIKLLNLKPLIAQTRLKTKFPRCQISAFKKPRKNQIGTGRIPRTDLSLPSTCNRSESTPIIIMKTQNFLSGDVLALMIAQKVTLIIHPVLVNIKIIMFGMYLIKRRTRTIKAILK